MKTLQILWQSAPYVPTDGGSRLIVKAENDPTYEYESESVEIRLPTDYCNYCMSLTPTYSRATMYFIQGAMELGYTQCDFFLPNIPKLSAIAIVKAFKQFGIEISYEEFQEEDEKGLMFHADMSDQIFFD